MLDTFWIASAATTCDIKYPNISDTIPIRLGQNSGVNPFHAHIFLIGAEPRKLER